MKSLYSIILSFICLSVFAQKSDSTRTYYRIIRGGLIEHATELKSKRYIKNGESEIRANKHLAASGLYKDGERYGRWRFFDGPDSVEQVYNYTTKKVEINKPIRDILYEVDGLKTGDRIIYPAKIGGFNLGLRFLLKEYIPSKSFRPYVGIHVVKLIFHINEEGKLVKYETETGEGNLKEVINIDLKNLRPEDFEFTPAYLNNKPVASRLIFKSKLTVD
ncbi:hypothetical protein [Pedobacter mendelii]|uniref:TonB C-terminal domain-containing protein n=1 Tax=Pedobacter mendelii TaxID=1908240 RepID=A0ABQ2BJ62_9SPHI|nr:hypothetical protein [Pedobacter mendelii]GGI24705.1 hypothetical protein GCM10008119_13990 [Pedobacter mendelii]